MSVTTTNSNTALMSFIERAANNPEFDVQKFGELLRLQRDVGHDQARRAFNAAMADAQSEMLPVVRDAKNSHLGNRYARLETIDAAMRPIYTRHGFSVRFGSAPSPRDGDIRIICTVAHSGGYFEENHLDAPLGTVGSQGGRTATTPVQAVGSAVTYLRRYLLTMVFNIVLADDDDDGEGTRRAAATEMQRAPRISEPATKGRNEAVRDEIIAAYDAVTTRKDYLATTDKYLKRVDWFRENKPAIANEISNAMSVAWERSGPDEPEPEALDDDPFAPGVEINNAEKLAAG